MTILLKYKEFRFRALVDRQVDSNRYMLSSVYNITLDRPFRNHVWVTSKKNNLFHGGKEITFDATIMLYKKKSGKCRLGLTDFKNVKQS